LTSYKDRRIVDTSDATSGMEEETRMQQAIALNMAIEIIDGKRQMSGANQAIWSMLHRAQRYLEAQMAEELRK
jgi:hypothetical protein